MVSLFFPLKKSLSGHYIVSCPAHRSERLCHANSGDLVPTTLAARLPHPSPRDQRQIPQVDGHLGLLERRCQYSSTLGKLEFGIRNLDSHARVSATEKQGIPEEVELLAVGLPDLLPAQISAKSCNLPALSAGSSAITRWPNTPEVTWPVMRMRILRGHAGARQNSLK